VGESQRRKQFDQAIALAVRSVFAFDEPAEGNPRTAPTEFRLFRYGVNATAKGDFIFDERSAASVMAAYTARQMPLMGDYEHQSLSQPPVKAPASITQFVPEVRADSTGKPELWATSVVWTDTARAHLEAGEYRLYSPAFIPDKEGRIESLINVALTNLPATYGLEPLVAASEPNPSNEESTMDEEKLKELGAKLAQAEKDREEFKGMCQKMSDTVKKLTGKTFDEWAAEESAEHEGGEESAEESKALKALTDTVAAVTGKSDLIEAAGALTSMAAQAKELVELKAAQAATAKDQAEKDFISTLEGGITAGKIMPFEKESILSLKGELGTAKALKWLNGRLDATKEPIVQLKAPTQPTPAEAVDPMALVIAGNSAGAFGGVESFKKMRTSAL
jgi:phage I-like protein